MPSLAADTSALLTTSRSHLSGGDIAGAVIGAVAGVALIAGGAFLLRKKHKKGRMMRQQQTELDNEDFYADPFNNQAYQIGANGARGYTDHDPMDIHSADGSTGRDTQFSGGAVGMPPMTPRHQTPYVAGPQIMSDAYDEYGHPREESFWSSVSQKFKSIRC